MLQNSPLFHLYATRLRDFYRQPARIFWVYGFPTVLAVVLGLAFQNRPPAPVQVDLIEGPGASWIKEALEAHNAALERERAAGHPRLDVPAVAFREVPEAEAMKRLKTGKTPLLIEPTGSESCAYRYDPTRPEAAAARQAVDDILQRSKHRENPVSTQNVYVTEPGSRYVRLPDPRPDRGQHHGRRALGHRLHAGELPDRQAAQAVRGDAHAPSRLPAGPPGGPAHLPDPRPDRAPGAGHPDVPDADPREPRAGHPGGRGRRPGLRRRSACWSPAGRPPPRPSAG